MINIFRRHFDSGSTCTKYVMFFSVRRGTNTATTSEFDVRVASTWTSILGIKCLERKKLVHFPWGKLELGLELWVIVETNSVVWKVCIALLFNYEVRRRLLLELILISYWGWRAWLIGLKSNSSFNIRWLRQTRRTWDKRYIPLIIDTTSGGYFICYLLKLLLAHPKALRNLFRSNSFNWVMNRWLLLRILRP